jgi:nicotinamidase-related amidase
MSRIILFMAFVLGWDAIMSVALSSANAEDFQVRLRSLTAKNAGEAPISSELEQKWEAAKTAIIVCDCWDYHHSINAVRRLEQIAPRIDQVLKTARKKGSTIIHAPSDCMDSYTDHPARRRATSTVAATNLPPDITSWCSQIPAEEKAIYPVDQSDGGEDDDPTEHAAWAEKLKSMGRNPGMPWKKQIDSIQIDADRDFISDRGDEVWNILTDRKIEHVILIGVHTNMCVLGRPFGLRQLSRNGMQVVLMRDMTDCMYNPKRWPYVDHFTGNDLVVAHIEQFVCPTITSDQLIGGKPYRFKEDTREQNNANETSQLRDKPSLKDFEDQWMLVSVPNDWEQLTGGAITEFKSVAWYRCALRLPTQEQGSKPATLTFAAPVSTIHAWLNGKPLVALASSDADSNKKQTVLEINRDAFVAGEANLLVIRVDHQTVPASTVAPVIRSGETQMSMQGRWQLRVGDDEAWANIPLPAKFGASPDVYFELKK